MLHAVIMAGGSGTRFWPASRRDTPKQLLNLLGDRTMIQSTVDRLGGLVDPQQVMVVTNQRLVTSMREQLAEVPADRIIGEPCKRDTAPCVGLAAGLLASVDPEAIMIVLPADHVIRTNESFQKAIRSGIQLIEEDPGRIVTFGIAPSYPSESFGYIERGDQVSSGDGVFQVNRFREKPDAETAKAYLDAGSFYWNSGIFMWRAQTILEALREYEPQMAERLATIAQAAGSSNFQAVLEREFAAIQGKSIDYAVMEHYDNVLVVEAPFQWDDVGSWQAWARLLELDDHQNAVQGSHIGIDTKGSIIRGEQNHTIVTIGVEDLVIVQTPDATLVAPKAAEERIREVVKRLEEESRDDLL